MDQEVLNALRIYTYNIRILFVYAYTIIRIIYGSYTYHVIRTYTKYTISNDDKVATTVKNVAL